MTIFLGADHAGFLLKESIKKYLETLGYTVNDLGAYELNPTDDYPDFGYPVAKKVAAEKGKGILFCGNAEGICILANKIDGVRAGIGYSEYAARTMREDDDANILCLPGRVLGEEEAKKIVYAWLVTEFSDADRHKRRLTKMKQIEEKE